MFTPKIGEDSQFDEYFSEGLVQPPISFIDYATNWGPSFWCVFVLTAVRWKPRRAKKSAVEPTLQRVSLGDGESPVEDGGHKNWGQFFMGTKEVLQETPMMDSHGTNGIFTC